MEQRSSIVWVGIAIVLLVVLGVGSSYFLGENNPIEKVMEVEAEELVEKEFHMIPGTLKTEFDSIFECTQKGFQDDFKCVEQTKS